MKHLSSQQMVDAIENGRAYEAHVVACPTCRREIDELRRTLASARELDVPEPSPLFWRHFSDRVREAVTSESVPSRSWLLHVRWTAAMSAAVALIVVGWAVATRTPDRAVSIPAREPVVAEVESWSPVEDDVSLAFMGDLAEQMDWDSAAEAGLVVAPGSAERAIQALSADERQLAVELLEKEIQRSKSL